ncbi:MAG: SpoIID/LytB domain-containing protein [Vicinamibacterales bacterium]
MRALLTALVSLLLLGAVSDRVAPNAGLVSRASAQAAPIGASTVRVGVLRDGKYDVVTLPMETYVARVLAGEAAPDSPPASLEALAIAIRTYTETNRGRHGSDGFDLCDQTHCQVMRTATAVTERAALATAEQVLLYQGSPATVFYSASCGGRSEKPSNVWPGADDPSYLSIHDDDDGCGGFPMWSAELAIGDLQRALRAGGYTGTLRDVRLAARNDSGRAARLMLDGMTPSEFTGQDLRMVVGRTLGFQHLQSAQFDLRRNGNAFRFSGRGAGHGVGLCVIGSMKRAARGQSAAEILARYFPGTQIGPLGPRLTSVSPPSPRISAPSSSRVSAVPAPAAVENARTIGHPPHARRERSRRATHAARARRARTPGDGDNAWRAGASGPRANVRDQRRLRAGVRPTVVHAGISDRRRDAARAVVAASGARDAGAHCAASARANDGRPGTGADTRVDPRRSGGALCRSRCAEHRASSVSHRRRAAESDVDGSARRRARACARLFRTAGSRRA